MNATDADGVVVVPAKTPKVGSGILEHWEQTYDPTKFAAFNVSQHHAYMANMSNDLFRLKKEKKGSSSEDSVANATAVRCPRARGMRSCGSGQECIAAG